MDRTKVILGAILSLALLVAVFGIRSGMQSPLVSDTAPELPEYRVLDTVDQSFAEANPNAEACYLGSLRDDAFTPPPVP